MVSFAETDHPSNAFHSQGIGGEPSVLVGAFNISENGDGAFPAFNQVTVVVTHLISL